MRRDPSKTYVVFLPAFAVMLLVFTFGLTSARQTGVHSLFQYQIKKIEKAESVDEILLGDSSLGNAVNAELYAKLTDKKVLNLALTEAMGFAGDYLLFQRVLERHRPKRIILMHTPAVFGFPIAISGYLQSPVALLDASIVHELGFERVFNEFFRVYFALPIQRMASIQHQNQDQHRYREEYLREHDYMPQGKPKPITASLMHVGRDVRLRQDKLFFLRKIVAMAHSKAIEVIYMHPPLAAPYLERVTDSLDEIDITLRRLGVKVAKARIAMSQQHIGDAIDHPAPQFRDLFTRKIVDVVHPREAG